MQESIVLLYKMDPVIATGVYVKQEEIDYEDSFEEGGECINTKDVDSEIKEENWEDDVDTENGESITVANPEVEKFDDESEKTEKTDHMLI